MPNFRQEVKTKDGFVKTVVADSEVELAEGVAAVQNDSYPISPDLHNPVEANQVVSPDNLHTEPAPSQPVEPVPVEPEQPKSRKVVRSAKSGEFVSKKQAKAEPDTTVTETV